jgi:hypothetical protein
VGDSGETQEHGCYPRQIEPRPKEMLRSRGSEYRHLVIEYFFWELWTVVVLGAAHGGYSLDYLFLRAAAPKRSRPYRVPRHMHPRPG